MRILDAKKELAELANGKYHCITMEIHGHKHRDEIRTVAYIDGEPISYASTFREALDGLRVKLGMEPLETDAEDVEE